MENQRVAQLLAVVQDDEWAAFCPTCLKVLDHCPNGNFAQAAAEKHTTDTGHKVYLLCPHPHPLPTPRRE